MIAAAALVRRRPFSPAERVGVACATALAASLLFFRIGARSLWLDEAFSVELMLQPWPAAWHHIAATEVNMIAWHALLKLWLGIADGEAFVRALSALFAVATVPVQALVARRLCGPKTGVVAALLLAAHVYLIRYGQEARAYAMVCFFSTLTMLLLLRAAERPTLLRQLGCALSAAALLHCHVLGVLVAAGQAAGVLWLCPPRSRLALLPAGLVAALLSAPLLHYFVAHRGGDNIEWIRAPSIVQVIDVAQDLLGIGAVALVYLVLIVGALWRARGTDEARGLAVAATWWIVPLALLLLASLVARPMFLAKYLIGAVPAGAIVAADGLARLPRRRLALAWAALGLASVGSLYWFYAVATKEDWRGAVNRVVSEARPGDGIVVLPPYLRAPVDYYLQRHGPEAGMIAPVYPAAPWGRYEGWSPEVRAEVHRAPDAEWIAARPGRLWLLARDLEASDPRTRPLLLELAARGYRRVDYHFEDLALCLLYR